MSDDERDYLVEAMAIILEKTMMLAEREHLVAMWFANGNETVVALLKARELYGRKE